MAPDERRAALIAATIPLLREHGLDVTTRQIAQAAGVAEGTIFGVFPDKTSLMHAALAEALAPAHGAADLAGIDPADDLRTRLCTAAALLQRGFVENAALFAALRTMAFTTPDNDLRARMLAGRERAVATLSALIEPDRARLRREPADVAGFLLLLVAATSHGAFGGNDRSSPDELVSILLDGLLIRSNENLGGAVRC